MKFKTTKKAIMAGYTKCISVGYCSMQYLLRYEEPIAYTSGVYGWNADIYSFGNICIVTGYRPFGNIHPDYEVIEKYELEASKIAEDWHIPYNERRQRLHNMVMDMLGELTAK